MFHIHHNSKTTLKGFQSDSTMHCTNNIPINYISSHQHNAKKTCRKSPGFHITLFIQVSLKIYFPILFFFFLNKPWIINNLSPKCII